MMKKIDIHCHVLPKLDDGSASLAESLQMLKLAYKQGIEAVIATPHASHQFKESSPEDIKNLCRALEIRARKEISPDFKIYPGQEIFYSRDTLEKLERGQLLTMAGSDYILLEFMPNVPYSEIFRAVRELTMAGYHPILAHIERYGVLRVKGRIGELLEAGAYTQMNYRRIGGKWYEETVRWCRKMLKQGNIHFLATDMHNMRSRKPETISAEVWMTKHLEKANQRAMFYGNAEKLLGIRDQSQYIRRFDS